MNESRRKANDPIYSRTVLRYLTPPITRALLRTRLTPNQITVVWILLMFVGVAMQAAQAVRPVAIAGAVLLHVAILLDAVDGEVARAKRIFSVKGVYLDMVAHRLVHGALFIAIAVGLYRRDGTVVPLFLALAASWGELGYTLVLYAKWRALLDQPALLRKELDRIESVQAPEARKRARTGFSDDAAKPSWPVRLYRFFFGANYVDMLLIANLALTLGNAGAVFLWIYAVVGPLRTLWAFGERLTRPFEPDLPAAATDPGERPAD